MHLDKIRKLLKIRLKANIALTSVLLAGAVLVVTGIAILYNAIDVTIVSKNFVSRQFAELKIASCVEESMNRLVKNSSFLGNFTLTFDEGSCTAVITNIDGQPNLRSLQITAVSGEYTVRRSKRVDISTSPLTLTN